MMLGPQAGCCGGGQKPPRLEQPARGIIQAYAPFFPPDFAYHEATPPCPLHAPCRSAVSQYRPSLHRAVAPRGFLPNHAATPPCDEQAPFWDADFDQVLSEQRAVAVPGPFIFAEAATDAPAGAFAPV